MPGKVGVAPGTTTLTIGPDGRPQLVGAGLGYFDAKPTDFDLSTIYGYTPVRRGWLRGEIVPGGLGACCQSCADGGPCDSELGDTDVSISTVWLSVLVAGGAAAGAAMGGRRSAGWGTAGAAGGALAGLVALSIFQRMGRWIAE